MDISVIVPLYNETESLPELAAWIRRVMEANGYTYEILMVDDGSTDGSWDTVLSPCTRASRPRRGTSSSPWTQTCRTPRTRFRNCTG